MQYQRVTKNLFQHFIGVILPPNLRCIKGTFILCYSYTERESKMTRQFKKQIQNQSQSGRSMVEMLGVLAIIAILSIGGIVGFRLAMNYYQANQIAHEMNIMRTDAQIKIAQGTEELTLGDPYDSGNIQFNGYKTDFDCLYMETETSEPELASCAVANAYYIEMQKIPEGICKPLTNLIDKMDNEIAFYINGKSVDAAEGEKGACDEGGNTLTAIFGADSDSNAVKCDDVSECPENLPICFNHMCVECETNAQCSARGKDPYCDKETHRCESCPDGGRYQTEYNACVIDVETKFFITPNPSCTKITPRPFGPYKHSYEIWGHGTIDDFLLLYLNKEGPEDTSDVTKCNSGYDAIRHGCGDSKRDFCPDFKLWDLKAGDYGNLVVGDPVTWGSWGIGWVDETEGKPHRNDGKIWLILKDE